MRKKRIVAMALAMSIFASTFGTLGAAAADTEPIEDTAGAPFTVTVVSLDSSEDAADSDTAVEPATMDTPTVLPAITDGAMAVVAEEPADSEDTDKEPDYSQIERPDQSDTVETLPGDSKDNEEHIKGEDKDTTETPAEGEDKETPAEDDKDTETEPEEPDDTNYDVAYDEKNGHFKITFNIKEDAEGDQTIELSKVQEIVNDYGKQAVEEYLVSLDPDSEEYKKYDDYLYYGWPIDCKLPNGLTFNYDPVSKTASIVEEPGCTTVFDVSLSNGSKHTYVYKNNSFTVSTPDMSNTDKTGTIGFDGQELPEEVVKALLKLEVSLDPNDNGCLEELVDKALAECGYKNTFRIDSDGSSTGTTSTYVSAGTELVKIGSYYYVKAGDYYFGRLNLTKKDYDVVDGKYYLKNDKTNVDNFAYTSTGTKAKEPVQRGGKGTLFATSGNISSALGSYLRKHNTDISSEILNYYNEKDSTSYETVADLYLNNKEAAENLSKSGASTGQRITVKTPEFYDNFYKNILSFNVGSKDDMDQFLQDSDHSTEYGHEHGEWANDGYQMTIADYMTDKLNSTEGAWDKANAYFNQLLQTGMSPNEATWAAFTMAVNIDGEYANNNYQDSAWNWYASMVLEQADGKFELIKADADDPTKVIGEDGAEEDQTSFYLWTYGKDEDGNDTTLYYTNVPDEVDEDGNVTKPGFTGWAKYDPDNKNLTYTITTTNGKLDIDYDLLKNVVYYLQEAAAPEGYDIDTTVYVICDSEEEFNKIKESGQIITNVAAGTTSSSSDLSYIGAITPGGPTLTVTFVNSKTITPDPNPDSDPVPPPVPPVNPVDPENPDVPVDPENPDLSPVQDATPDAEAPVLPENPSNPAVQNARADVLPQTGTTSWMAGVLMGLGSMLMACGWFFTRKQHAPKH